MKAGTTTIYRWIAAMEGFASCDREPNTLAGSGPVDEGKYRGALNADSGKSIDASPIYLDPLNSARVAANVQRLNPSASIVIDFRDNLGRAVSHVHHDYRRGRLSELTAESIARQIRPGTVYFERSRYSTAIAPWLERFSPDRICILSSTADDDSKMRVLAKHLGVELATAQPAERFNETQALPRYSSAMRLLVDRFGITEAPRIVPPRVREAAKRVLLRPAAPSIAASAVREHLSSEVVDQLVEESDGFRLATNGCRWAT